MDNAELDGHLTSVGIRDGHSASIDIRDSSHKVVGSLRGISWHASRWSHDGTKRVNGAQLKVIFRRKVNMECLLRTWL